MSNENTGDFDRLSPLFAPHEEPTKHRAKGGVVQRRRPSPLPVVQNLRMAVREWREAFYPGASETTRHLLHHWFSRAHRVALSGGGEAEFRYYFCQREAIETLIYLREVRGVETTSQLWMEFGSRRELALADGISPEEDAWARHLCKLATGAGKTKVMSLVVVWSYFHVLREADSPLARHFVIIAPNIIVFERLREDFRPDGGGPDIFDKDPLIPPEWRGDWNMSVILQDEAGGAATGGTLYLTNIHRLYERSRGRGEDGDDSAPWAGPSVNRNKALDTAAALRERVLHHKRVFILNDEAHHVWDTDSAWFEAIKFFHETLSARGGKLVGQIDFTATPRDNRGQPLKHIICDAPLGEAVDAGIVKTPVLGTASDGMEAAPSADAGERYDRHLRLGYERWEKSFAEWQRSGKKPLLFVMCEDTEDADQITRRLQTDPVFSELNGKTLNLHTNLKGKIKKGVFVPNEKEISDDDLRALRKLSRELDSPDNPYRCMVSVLMLREGWDVRNVTTIVPLRALSAKNKVLGEQVLGRGLRRMTPPVGGAAEVVTVVEHEFFARFYQEELSSEGVDIDVTDVNRVPKTTVSIYPDEARKDVAALDIHIPQITVGATNTATLGDIDFDEVKKAFKQLGLPPLSLGKEKDEHINYEGRHLVTGEILEKMKIHLPLLHTGIGAVSYFVKELEMIAHLRGAHAKLAPLLVRFWTEVLFGKQTPLNAPALLARLGDGAVREYTRAVFVPLLRRKTTLVQQRVARMSPVSSAAWKLFQATDSETHPVKTAKRTLFNLVPCNRQLEAAFTDFLEEAGDVVAFVKNAGPQCLRIDYLDANSRLAFYVPDFFARLKDGRCLLIETKGREDRDVPRKARAAVEWCKSASAPPASWDYLYVSEGLFGRTTATTLAALASEAAPELTALVNAETTEVEMPLFAYGEKQVEKAAGAEGAVDTALLDALPPRSRKAAEEAVALFRFYENKPDAKFAPLFQPLLAPLDAAAKNFIFNKLSPEIPTDRADQEDWFSPTMRHATPKEMPHYDRMGKQLKRLMLWNNPATPIGLLRDCFEFALDDKTPLEGVFAVARERFRFTGARDVAHRVGRVAALRNRCIAHGGADDAETKKLFAELGQRNFALAHLTGWLELLAALCEK
ncbi:DEAD/DEAH box helicase [Geminisphaera colitermitum]|uniref:DEAD/DEAH box helicase n=1 Tax=Geminisphaera colitermitum TaxID=1148786 RepID=UPI000158CCE5|nr:DEAD/DEAH box helicase family protein [Geminisphaera colitermitum]